MLKWYITQTRNTKFAKKYCQKIAWPFSTQVQLIIVCKGFFNAPLFSLFCYENVFFIIAINVKFEIIVIGRNLGINKMQQMIAREILIKIICHIERLEIG